jgi:hypothetical protein
MTEHKKVNGAAVREVSINYDVITRKAKSVQEGLDLYSNFQRVTATSNEVVIDFYVVAPDNSNLDIPKAVHLQRVIIPTSIAANFGKILQEVIVKMQRDNSVVAEFTPEKAEAAPEKSEG